MTSNGLQVVLGTGYLSRHRHTFDKLTSPSCYGSGSEQTAYGLTLLRGVNVQGERTF